MMITLMELDAPKVGVPPKDWGPDTKGKSSHRNGGQTQGESGHKIGGQMPIGSWATEMEARHKMGQHNKAREDQNSDFKISDFNGSRWMWMISKK